MENEKIKIEHKRETAGKKRGKAKGNGCTRPVHGNNAAAEKSAKEEAKKERKRARARGKDREAIMIRASARRK